MEVLTHPRSNVDAARAGQGHKYIFTRDLDQTPYGSRHLVLSADHHTSHLLHRLNRAFPTKPGSKERFERAIEVLQQADNPHILQVEEYGWDLTGPDGGEGIGPFVISDYTGDADGVVTLDRLIKLKGGWLTLEESKRAIEQLMGASTAAQQAGLVHGPLSMSQVHVDRRGSLLIELYGLGQQLTPTKTGAGDEVRSIAAIGYQLVTGLLPIKPIIPVEHMIEHIDPTWRDYFQTGLGTPGFSTAAHALAAVQGLRIAGGGGIDSMRTSLRDLIRSMLTPER